MALIPDWPEAIIPVVRHQQDSSDGLLGQTMPKELSESTTGKLSTSSAGATTKQKRHISESTKQMQFFRHHI